MKKRIGLLLTLLATLAVTAGCTTVEPGVYRGGVKVQEGPLDIQDHYSFRFVDKWRISHSWLSGPVELRGCQGYGSNSFRRIGGYGDLGVENMEPIIERNGVAYVVYEHKGVFKIGSPHNYIYGTNRYGEFQGFLPFCVHFFRDSLDGVGLYIVKPDSAKGTDLWVAGTQPVVINGLRWLHKKTPIQDWSESREQLAGPIEHWILKIPETEYWLMLRFAASSGSKKYGRGANYYPEKHQRLLDLFHKIVASVKLEPITPISVDPLLKETPGSPR